MLQKLNQVAQAAATNVSRRQLLGRIGRGAIIAAAGLGGLLAFASSGQAGRRIRVCWEFSGVAECRGKPLGSPCTGIYGEGRCWGKYEVAPGVYSCYECKPKGRNEKDIT